MTYARLITSLVLALLTMLGAEPIAAGPFEDVSMGTSVDVQDGHVVARWTQGGFDVYHVGWTENGGPRHALERAGDKRFVFLTVYHPGSRYDVGVQGCLKHTFGHDQCTSWTSAVCGERGAPCRAR